MAAGKTPPERVKKVMEYDKKYRYKIGTYVNKKYDTDILNFWFALPNKAEWLKNKIREEIAIQKQNKG